MLLQPYCLELINKTLKLIVALGSGSGRLEAKNEAKACASRNPQKQVLMG